MNEHQNNQRPDALVDLYREASAQDRGPSSASTAQILAHATAQAAQAPAAGAGEPATPAGLNGRSEQGSHFSGEAANDRRWWLQALGSLAAIGLVSWLALQHLNEPGAPQLDAPQLDSVPSTAESAPASPPTADMAASPSAKIRSEMAPMGMAASPATEAAQAPAGGASAANVRPSPAIAPAPQAERRMPPAQAPAPTPPPRPAPAAAVAPIPPAAPALSKKQAAQDMRATERPAPPVSAAPAAAPAATPALPAPQALPNCGPRLDAQALAEQRRRIQAYDKALAAGLPLPALAPLCRPSPAHEAEPALPLDSR